MSSLAELLRRVADQLGETVPWALVGGLAVSARTEPRFTRDVDVVVAVEDDARAEDLVYRLRQAGYLPKASIEQEATDRLATVRLAGPGDSGLFVDLLFASSGIEAEIAQDAGALEIVPGLVVPVAQVWHLLAMKVLARDDRQRPQDLADLHNLLGVATELDLERTREALDLITERGFHRQKRLLVDFQQLLSDRRP